jgi:DNA-binding response OmpR family regulator
MRILIIDDETSRHEKFAYIYDDHDIDHAYSYNSAIGFLAGQYYDLIFFDHDLCEEKTGADVARWMAEHGITVAKAMVHSFNPDGARDIISILRSGNVCNTVERVLPP